MSHRTRRSFAAAVSAALAAGSVLVASHGAVPAASAEELPDAPPVVGSSQGPDPYFPQDGNGGYQVSHYTIDDRYRPATDELVGRTTVTAVVGDTALSAFHLDLRLTPDAVTVEGLGHHWPGGRAQLNARTAGPPSAAVNATEMIWEFFQSV